MVGSSWPTHTGAETTVEPAGTRSDAESEASWTRNGSLPATTEAPPPSVQPGAPSSKEPPSTSLYWFVSPHAANGWDATALVQSVVVWTRAAWAGAASAADAARTPAAPRTARVRAVEIMFLKSAAERADDIGHPSNTTDVDLWPPRTPLTPPPRAASASACSRAPTACRASSC